MAEDPKSVGPTESCSAPRNASDDTTANPIDANVARNRIFIVPGH
jgi:hypothetical protein